MVWTFRFLLSIDRKKNTRRSYAGFNRFTRIIYRKQTLQRRHPAYVDDMPPIDAVLITHDHYDHLDYPSILKLKEKAGHFFVPHGVSAHLIRWGVEKENHRAQLVG